MNYPQCTLCGSESQPYKDIQSYYRCQSCEGVFVWPVQNQSFYLESETYLSDPEVYTSLIDPKGFRFLIGHFEKHFQEKTGQLRGSVLEVGAGVGFAMFMLMSRDWDVAGIETSKAAAEWGNKYLRMPIQTSTIEDYDTTKHYDSIIMIEVLEHFLSAEDATTSFKKFLKPGGVVFGTTPNVYSACWNEQRGIFAPSDHIFLFGEKSLQVLCKKIHARNLSIDYFGTAEHPDSNFMFSFQFE